MSARAVWERGHEVSHRVADARLLFGSGRSGTTWLLQEIARLTPARPIFEPFHPIEVAPSAQVVPRAYLPPGEVAPELAVHARAVLAGRVSTDWTAQAEAMRPPWRYRGRVLKEIHSHLWAGWLLSEFPHLRTATVVRHPFAQVGSRTALAWSDRKLDLISSDEGLRETHVPDLDDYMRRASTPLTRGVLLWAIDNRVLLREVERASHFLLGYEEAVADPGVVGDLIAHFGFPRPADADLASESRRRASRMSQPGAATSLSGDENAKWFAKLDGADVSRALDLLDALGFGGVFSADGTVDIGVLRARVAAGLE